MFWPLILNFIPNFALSTPQNLEKKLLILINRNIKDQRTFSLAYEFTFNPNSALSTPQSLEKKVWCSTTEIIQINGKFL